MFLFLILACRSTFPDTSSLVCGEHYEIRIAGEATSLGPTATELSEPIGTLGFDVPSDSPFSGGTVSLDPSTATAMTATSDAAECRDRYQLLVEVDGELTLPTEGVLPVQLRFSRHDLPQNTILPTSFAVRLSTEAGSVPSPQLETYLIAALDRPVEAVREYRLEAEWSVQGGSRLIARPVFLTPDGSLVSDESIELEGSVDLDPDPFFPSGG